MDEISSDMDKISSDLDKIGFDIHKIGCRFPLSPMMEQNVSFHLISLAKLGQNLSPFCQGIGPPNYDSAENDY